MIGGPLASYNGWGTFGSRYWWTGTERGGDAPSCWIRCFLSTLNVLETHSTKEVFCNSFLSHFLHWKNEGQLNFLKTVNQVFTQDLFFGKWKTRYERSKLHTKQFWLLTNPERENFNSSKNTTCSKNSGLFLTQLDSIWQIKSYSACPNHWIFDALGAGLE